VAPLFFLLTIESFLMNILYDVVPKIMASATKQINEELPILRAVDTRYDVEAKKQGEVIFVPIDNSDMTVYDVVPGHTASNNPSTRQDTIPIVLNNWKEVAFELDDFELRSINDGVIPGIVNTKIRALRNEMARTIWDQYKYAHLFLGTPGQTPFDPDVDRLTIAKDAKRLLNKNMANSISLNRMMLLDTDAEANASMLDEFLKADSAGTDISIREGVIGRKLGFDWYFDNTEPSHPDNTLSTKAGFAIGTVPTTLSVENELLPRMNAQTRNLVVLSTPGTATGGVIKGDVFTVAGDDTTYVVESDATIDTANDLLQIQFYPAPKKQWVVNDAITWKEPHAVNLAMHDKAIAFAMAPFNRVSDTLGNLKISEVFIDPVSNMPLRLEVYQEYKRTRWSIDALWAVKTMYRDHVLRIAG
jgi:hypothetical protein